MKSLVIIAGPTASGKTSASLRLAGSLGAPVISADSRQVYQEMEIGTARATPRETRGTPYFLSGHISIHTPYTAADFAKEARQLCEDLFKTCDTIVVAGGSGLYLQAFLYGLDELPEIKPEIRQALNQQIQEGGLAKLAQQLMEVDPVYAETADLKNPRRVVRALELFLSTGQKYSSLRAGSSSPLPYPFQITGIDLPREELYHKIDQRVDEMFRNGLPAEAKRLYPYKHLSALNTVGYRELFRWMDGEIALEEAGLLIKKNTRNYAKRQMTWFRKMKVQWYSSASRLIEDQLQRIRNT